MNANAHKSSGEHSNGFFCECRSGCKISEQGLKNRITAQKGSGIKITAQKASGVGINAQKGSGAGITAQDGIGVRVTAQKSSGIYMSEEKVTALVKCVTNSENVIWICCVSGSAELGGVLRTNENLAEASSSCCV